MERYNVYTLPYPPPLVAVRAVDNIADMHPALGSVVPFFFVVAVARLLLFVALMFSLLFVDPLANALPTHTHTHTCIPNMHN